MQLWALLIGAVIAVAILVAGFYGPEPEATGGQAADTDGSDEALLPAR